MENRDKKKKPKISGGFIFYAVILLIVIGLSMYMSDFGSAASGSSDSLSDVLSYIDNDDYDVEMVNISGTSVTVEYTDNGRMYTVTKSVPSDYRDDLIDLLREAKADGRIEDYDYTEPVDWSMIINVVMLIGSVFLIVVLFMSITRQSKEGGGLYNFGQNKARLTKPNEIKVRFDDVAGSLEEKEELSEIVDFLKHPAKYKQLGAKIPKGVLLHGQPGTGKTLLARAVAGEAGVPFYYISGSDFLEMFVGVGASRVRSLFSEAKKTAPSVIFIDEIDAIGRKRGAGLGGGHDEREQTLNQILVEMDGFDGNTNIIVMAATNRVDVLDPALLRPGRFDRKIRVSEPDVDEREAILKIHAKGKPLTAEVNLKELAMSTVGFTGADLANLLNEAALLSARRNKKEITPLEIQDAMFRVMMGPEKNSKKLTDKVKKLTSVHEAGHAVVLRAISTTQKVDRVTIIPVGQAGGYTAYKPIEDNDFYTKGMLLESIMVSLGGRAAEEIFLGDISTGAASDLQHCNRLARNMVKRFGLSENYKNLVFGDDSDEVFLGSSFGHVQGYSEKTAAEIDDEVKKIIDECYAKTLEVLREKSGVVEGLAERLCEVLKVDSPEFEEIYLSNGDLTAIHAREGKVDAPAEVPAETASEAVQEVKPAEDSESNS